MRTIQRRTRNESPLGVVGLYITGANAANVIALNGADNGLHIVVGAVLLGVGLGAGRR